MALVSYDYSDSSDYEDDDEQKDELHDKISEVTLVNKKDNEQLKEEKKPFDVDDVTKKSTSSLPPPVEIKSNFNVVSWNLLSKNRTQPIRISIPSLEDDDDDKEDTKPKLKPSSTKSGLFAILPKPKQHLLVPQSLSRPKQVMKKTEVKKPSVKRPAKVNSNSIKIAPQASSSKENLSDDDEQQPQSFFFLPEEKGAEEKFNFEDIDKDIMGVSTPLEETNVTPSQLEPVTSAQTVAANDLQAQMPQYSSEYSSEVELDKEALEKLCGRRGKRLAGEIEMVNVSGAELVGDSKLWLAKDLTTQKVHHKKAKFDPLQRRKHQITFLAAHAREQELELSNQWANNRMTRKQTQAKYGF